MASSMSSSLSSPSFSFFFLTFCCFGVWNSAGFSFLFFLFIFYFEGGGGGGGKRRERRH